MDKPLVISSLLPLVDQYGCRVVRLTHNALDISPKLRKSGINLFFCIAYALHQNITADPGVGSVKYEEQKIKIPRRLLTKKHISNITDELSYLFSLAIVFSRRIPGMESQGITRLISSIECFNGEVIVSIPGEAIPWLLYCGTGVGFSLVEIDVLLRLPTVPTKLLYQYLLSKVDNKLQVNEVSIDMEDLPRILGIHSTRASSIMQKHISNFPQEIRDAGSVYRVSYRRVYQRGYLASRGRPRIEKLVVIVEKENNWPAQENMYTVIEKLFPIWTKYSIYETIGRVMLVDAITKSGREGEFISKMLRLSRQNENRQNFRWLSNATAKVLREDFGIEVFGPRKLRTQKGPKNNEN